MAAATAAAGKDEAEQKLAELKAAADKANGTLIEATAAVKLAQGDVDTASAAVDEAQAYYTAAAQDYKNLSDAYEASKTENGNGTIAGGNTETGTEDGNANGAGGAPEPTRLRVRTANRPRVSGLRPLPLPTRRPCPRRATPPRSR